MSKKSSRKVVSRTRGRLLTAAEAAKYRKVREQVMREFPPAAKPKLRLTKRGIGAQIRAVRIAKGLSWYAVAKQANVPNPATVRDIEYGRDAKLSNVEAIAQVLGLELGFVPAH
jgi:hypothetical protein